MDVYTLTKQQKFITWESKDNKFTVRKSLQKNFISMKFYEILHRISLNIIDHFGVFRQLMKTNIPSGAHSIICKYLSGRVYTTLKHYVLCLLY